MTVLILLLYFMSSLKSGLANTCSSLDQGPFLATNPTLQFEFNEATEADLQSAMYPSSYYSEVRVAGVYNVNISLSIDADNNVLDISEYFSFVYMNGKNFLKLMKPIDRDGQTSSPEDDNTFLTFTLICTSVDQNETYDAIIVIKDVNDNFPEFFDGGVVKQITLKEATPVGTIIYYASATDKDANLEANLTYTLLTNNDTFSIDPTTGAVNVTKDLDYEHMISNKTLTLVFTVMDGGPNIIFTSTSTVNVKVTDSDDQSPAFEYPGCFKYAEMCAWPKYTAGRQLTKNSAIQVYPVPNTDYGYVSITAYDQDIAIGNEIKFSIASTIPPGLDYNYEVTTMKHDNKYTANIIPLVDSEVLEGFQIFLKAEEVSSNRRHTLAMILFTGNTATPPTTKVCEPLDNGPYLDTKPTLVIEVDEAITEEIQAARQSGSMKYHSPLRISGNYGLQDFSLNSNYDMIDPFQYFDVVNEKGVNYMRLVKAIDRDAMSENLDEQLSFMTFTLTCTPSNTSLSPVVYDVQIFINDVNDNIPMFVSNNNSKILRLSEVTAPGKKIYTAVATDKDSNIDGNLTYSMVTSEYFSIDPLTGEVTLSKALDYESMVGQKTINLTLKVEDAGPGMRLTATMMLQVMVTDADDNDPAFVYTGCFTHLNVCAWPKYTSGLNLKQNEVVKVYPVPNKVNGYVSINAMDLDTDIGNEIIFSIASTIPPGQESNFKVETVKGQGNDYLANIIPMSDKQLTEGFEIFLKAEERSENKRQSIAMIYFTTTPSTATAEQQQGSDSSSSNNSGYTDLEIALIVVVSILAAFLVSLVLGMVIFNCLCRKSSDKASFSTSM